MNKTVDFKSILLVALIISNSFPIKTGDLYLALDQVNNAPSNSLKSIYLSRALTFSEQQEALEEAIELKALTARDSGLLKKLRDARSQYEIDKRLVVLQYLLSSEEYVKVLTDKLNAKINQITYLG